MNALIVRAVLTRELDTALYRVASIASLSGYLGYHCYFMGKEVYVTADDLVAFSQELYSYSGYPVYEQMFYNYIWAQTPIFTNARIIKRIFLDQIDFNDFYPTNKLQQVLYVLFKHLGLMIKPLIIARTETNEYVGASGAPFGDYYYQKYQIDEE